MVQFAHGVNIQTLQIINLSQPKWSINLPFKGSKLCCIGFYCCHAALLRLLKTKPKMLSQLYQYPFNPKHRPSSARGHVVLPPPIWNFTNPDQVLSILFHVSDTDLAALSDIQRPLH